MKFVYVTVLLVGVALLTPSRSSALCWSYRNVIGHCNGAGGCQGQYQYSVCMVGCISGECNNNGGSGLCCGSVLYHSAVIYPDGNDCSGGNCGYLPVRSASRHSQRKVGSDPPSEEFAVLHRGSFYRSPGLRFMPDRCRHAYAVVIEDGTPIPEGGF